MKYIIDLNKINNTKYYRVVSVLRKNFYLMLNRFKRISKKTYFMLIKKNTGVVEKLLLDYPIISRMVTENQLKTVLTTLKMVLEENIDGDIVELGCYAGTTSLFIRRLLDKCDSEKKFHVYDSFKGLPEKKKMDETNNILPAMKSYCKVEKTVFIDNFRKESLKLPEIHAGWFGKMPDSAYPERISFAFFDGDFYDSIMDSFNKVYPKMVANSVLIIHDYNRDSLPGVERACDDFLKDKPEKGNIKIIHDMGVMVKV